MSTVLVLSPSGAGKSSSIRNLDPKETFILQVVKKDLPFKEGRKNYSTEAKNLFVSDDYEVIIKSVEKINQNKAIKTLVIDDAQYIMGNEFMKRAKEKGLD